MKIKPVKDIKQIVYGRETYHAILEDGTGVAAFDMERLVKTLNEKNKDK